MLRSGLIRGLFVVGVSIGAIGMLSLVAADPPAASPPGAAQPASPDAITKDAIPTLLTNLGYEPTADGSDYIIAIERDGWTFRIRVGLYTSDKYLWLWGYLNDLPAADKCPVDRVIKILETNNSVGPSHFFVANGAEGRKLLYLGKAMENRGLKPATIRTEIDAWCAIVKSTQEVWDVTKWSAQPAGSAPAAPSAPGTTASPPASPTNPH